MKEYTALEYHDRVNSLGEGILWHDSKLFWVDITEGLVFEHDAVSGMTKTFAADDFATTLWPWENNKLIVSGQRNIYLFNRQTKEKELYLTIPDVPENYRLNDGKCDSFGRFFVGTMRMDSGKGEGKLYRIDKDKTITPLLDGISCSNGLCWDKDNKTMYYIDTPTRHIKAFDYNAETGGISNGRVCVDVSGCQGYPDGMTIDNSGMLWVAMYGGYSVLCFDPLTAELLAKVSVPAERTTSCAFGEGNRLFISSAGGKTYYAEIS